MSYPQPPWNIQGFGFQTLQLLDLDRVSPLIPTELEIVSVFPGKTLGGVYLASYSQGSTLVYNELIVFSAIVHQVGKMGVWISHIYVDHPDSMAGGREIWGLPKQLAQFTWQTTDALSVRVSQGDRLLCTLTCNWQLPGWQQSLSGKVFSMLDAKLIQFAGQGTLKLHLSHVDLQVPPESQFAELGIGQPWLGFYLNPLRLTVDAPVFSENQRTNL